jgi:hypothetical protein
MNLHFIPNFPRIVVEERSQQKHHLRNKKLSLIKEHKGKKILSFPYCASVKLLKIEGQMQNVKAIICCRSTIDNERSKLTKASHQNSRTILQKSRGHRNTTILKRQLHDGNQLLKGCMKILITKFLSKQELQMMEHNCTK